MRQRSDRPSSRPPPSPGDPNPDVRRAGAPGFRRVGPRSAIGTGRHLPHRRPGRRRPHPPGRRSTSPAASSTSARPAPISATPKRRPAPSSPPATRRPGPFWRGIPRSNATAAAAPRLAAPPSSSRPEERRSTSAARFNTVAGVTHNHAVKVALGERRPRRHLRSRSEQHRAPDRRRAGRSARLHRRYVHPDRRLLPGSLPRPSRGGLALDRRRRRGVRPGRSTTSSAAFSASTRSPSFRPATRSTSAASSSRSTAPLDRALPPSTPRPARPIAPSRRGSRTPIRTTRLRRSTTSGSTTASSTSAATGGRPRPTARSTTSAT